VDFGITLGASGSQYGTIRVGLGGLGFTSEGDRSMRRVGNLNLYLDFLTEDPPSLAGSRIADDVTASGIPAVNRATDGPFNGLGKILTFAGEVISHPGEKAFRGIN
jgi:hypothetical protein